MSLPPSFIETVLRELSHPGIIGVSLVGSHARGDAGPFSDVDLDLFVPTEPADRAGRYRLRYIEDRLVSIKTTTTETLRDMLRRPEKAIWAAPGLSQMTILLDRDGSVEQLKRDAIEFRWEDLQEEANGYASYQLMHVAEECHKILGALVSRDESTILYALAGLHLGLTDAVAVGLGLMIRSENGLFRQVQEAAGVDSAWSHAHRIAAGYETIPDAPHTPWQRGRGALDLYRETARLMEGIIAEEHRDVVKGVLARIEGEIEHGRGRGADHHNETRRPPEGDRRV